VKYLKANSLYKIEIAGHTDDVGDEQNNLSLSERRAKTVANYLIQKGIPKDRIVAVGYGESLPVVPNISESDRAKNRRVEIKIL
jgi:outer membrane protein OmpA-like peptidoglycan-associated protein